MKLKLFVKYFFEPLVKWVSSNKEPIKEWTLVLLSGCAVFFIVDFVIAKTKIFRYAHTTFYELFHRNIMAAVTQFLLTLCATLITGLVFFIAYVIIHSLYKHVCACIDKLYEEDE